MSKAGLFTRVDLKAGRKSAAVKGAKSDLPIETLHRIGLRGVRDMNSDARSPNMQPTGAERPDIYILGEAPGATEDEQGRQFVGKSGKELRAEVEGWNSDLLFRWDNCCRTRPPGNRTPTPAELECFRPSVVASIEEARPLAVLAVGGVPINWAVTGLGGVTKARGRRVAARIGKHACWVYPIFHPSYILRVENDKKSKPPGSEYRRVWESDIERAMREVAGGIGPPAIVEPEALHEGVRVLTAAADVERELERFGRMKRTTVDLETNQLRPYHGEPLLLSAAVGTKDEAVAFAVDHEQAGWSRKDRKRVVAALRRYVFSGGAKTVHNLAFDLEWFVHLFGRKAARASRWEDTMQQAYVLDERSKSHSLNYCCKVHLGLSVKEHTDVDRKRLADAELDRVLPYNAADVKVTDELYRRQRRLVKAQKLTGIYREHVVRIPTLVLAQFDGVPVSQSRVGKFRGEYEKKAAKVKRRIAASKYVKQYEKRFGGFNPTSPDQVKVLLRDVIKSDAGVRGNKYSTDEKVLRAVDKRVAVDIIELRQAERMLATYIERLDADHPDSYVYPDGKIHTVFNSTFTTTGRLSSERPNVQNYPKRDPERKRLRRVFVPEPGSVFVAVDYGQIEARAIAWASKDKTLVDALWKNYDIHTEWAERILKVWSKTCKKLYGGTGKDERKRWRDQIKNNFTFPLFFGARMGYVASMLEMPERMFEPLFDEFWHTFSGVKKMQAAFNREYRNHFYVSTLTGRRRRAPMSENEIINTPIQGTASDVVVDAMNRLSVKAEEEDKPWLQGRMNIHDDLTFIVPRRVLDVAVEEIVHAMLDVPYPFVNTPVQVEVEIGETDWYSCKEIGKFQSHEVLG